MRFSWAVFVACSFAATTTAQDLLNGVISGLGADANSIIDVLKSLQSDLEALHPTSTPTSPEDAFKSLSKIFAKPTQYFDSAAKLVLNGFDPRNLEGGVFAFSAEANSFNNSNLREPVTAVYPAKGPNDALYSISELELRSAIYFPETFTYGEKPAVILFPGTAVPGGETWAASYYELLRNTSFADPLWVNVPGQSLADAQVTAEYAAYAINYVSKLNDANVSIITFSQGSLNVQWALKYWPSTREVVSDFIALSPDFRGTTLAALLCPPFPNIGCTPSILQQENTSEFIRALQLDDGDSAYVPTTTIFSTTDQIVQPQNRLNGSGLIYDTRNVGVSNTEIQTTCGIAQPAGSIYLHEGMLYNPLGFALAVDALTHDGPGDVSRLGTESLMEVCRDVVADGLGFTNLLLVESTFFVFVGNFLAFEPRAFVEPEIMGYAGV